MKLSLPALLAALLLGTIFTACQSSPEASANIWRRPDYFGGPKKSVAVAVLAYHADVRKEVEDALVAGSASRASTPGPPTPSSTPRPSSPTNPPPSSAPRPRRPGRARRAHGRPRHPQGRANLPRQ